MSAFFTFASPGLGPSNWSLALSCSMSGFRASLRALFGAHGGVMLRFCLLRFLLCLMEFVAIVPFLPLKVELAYDFYCLLSEKVAAKDSKREQGLSLWTTCQCLEAPDCWQPPIPTHNQSTPPPQNASMVDLVKALCVQLSTCFPRKLRLF